MKILLVLPLALVLSGCASFYTPVRHKFPEVPKELVEACPDLKQTEPTEKLSEVLKVVTENYSQYHECRIKADAWVEWYKAQQKIYNK